jgi:4-amino-4-deoxy-L-arabinose transferase-like glycosyltransferase
MSFGEVRVGILGLAFAFLGTGYFALGLVGQIYQWTLISLFIIWFIATLIALANIQEDPHVSPDRHRPGLPRVFLAILLFIVVLLSQLPPTAKDALIHHLAFPKLFLEKHALVVIPSASFSWYPMLADLLFLLPMSFGNDTIPALIHALFGFLTGRLLYLYLLRVYPARWAWFGTFLFLSIPVVFYLSSVAYVDLALVFFSLFALIGLLRWSEARSDEDRKKWFILSALAVGAAMATKYNGYIVFLYTLAALTWRSSHERDLSSFKQFKQIVSYTSLALIMAGPWLLRNLIDHGNPFFPLLSGSINQGGSVPPLLLRQELYQESWLEILALPVRMFFSGEAGQPSRFDGKLNPLLLLFPLFLLVRPRKEGPSAAAASDSRGLALFGLFSLMYFCYALMLGAARVRYIVPIVPSLIIVGIAGLVRFHEAIQKKWVTGALLTLALLYNGIYLVEYVQKLDPWLYWRGRETREAYLSKRLAEFPIYTYANNHLPEQAKVLLVFVGNRGYYFDRSYLYDSPLDGQTLFEIIENATGPQEIEAEFRRRGITHIVLNRPLATRYLSDRLGPDKWALFQKFAREKAKMLYGQDPFYLFEV